MVEVFKTDICEKDKADVMLEQLKAAWPNAKINFDLDDCDHILRVEGAYVSIPGIIQLLAGTGYYCEALE